jgi:hypothetical protein
MLFGGGKIVWQGAIKLSALSDGSETYAIRVGFFDSTGTVTDGAWFEYTHSANSGNWTGKTANNTATSTVNGGVAANTNWQKFTMIVAADGSTVDFYVDGVQLGTPLSTNIPTSAGRETGMRMAIIKSVGTTERTMTIDYISFTQKMTTAR